MQTFIERSRVAIVISAVWSLAATAGAQAYTDPVGFVKVEAVRDGLIMISMPFEPADGRLNGDVGCVGDMIGEPLTGGAAGGTADVLWKWDASTQSYKVAFKVLGWGPEYDGKWWDEQTGDFSTMAFHVGEACWIQRRGTGPDVVTIVFLGWAPMAEATTLTFVQGLTMFGWPYPVSVRLNDTALGRCGAGGAGAGVADVVFEWDPHRGIYASAFLIAGWGTAFDGKWWDEATGEFSGITLEPGEAMWYLHRPAFPAVCVIHRPY